MLRLVCIATAALFSLYSPASAQPPGGPGAFPGGPPLPGQILPGFLQEHLKMTAEQKAKLEKLQEQVDAGLAKILTNDQQRTLKEPMRKPFGEPGGFGGFPGPGGFGPPGGKGPPGGFSPPGLGGFGAFGGPPRLDDVKKQLGATDEEWQVIGAQLQKVTAARQSLLGQAAAGGPMKGNALGQAQAELRTLLADPKHARADATELVAAVRRARDRTRAELAAAQRELLQLVTEEQQAVLIGLGYID
jgi:Spy/CpxP family protein refolding chaperone